MKKIITLAISFLMTFANAQVQYCYNFNDGTANNSCGTTNNGTYIGPWAGLGTDRFGNANYAYYCGASASGGVNCGDISILNSDTSFTIAGWVQMITASNPNSNRYIFSKGGLALYLPQLSNYMTLTIGGQTYSGSTLGIAANYYNNPATNGFRFFAVTRQGSDLKVYTANDVYPLTYTGAAPSSSGSNFTIGYNTDMKADDILITNVAFSDTQIDSLKNLPNPFTPTPTPFAHVGYSFDKSDARNDLGTNNWGVINGATLTTDRFGNANKAFTFNGSTNQSINFGDVELLNNTDEYSISMWFSQDQLNVTAAGIWNKSKILA